MYHIQPHEGGEHVEVSTVPSTVRKTRKIITFQELHEPLHVLVLDIAAIVQFQGEFLVNHPVIIRQEVLVNVVSAVHCNPLHFEREFILKHSQSIPHKVRWKRIRVSH